MKTTDQPVEVTQVFKYPPARIWKAITSHKEMVQWYFENLPDFKPVAGFSTSFEVAGEHRLFTHQWEVISAEPLKCISYTWNYREFPGNSVLSMELFPEGPFTKLKVTHRTTVDFPDHIREFHRENCLKGWNYFIGERLTQYLH